MAQLTLRFTGMTHPELVRMELESERGEIRRLVRGKTGGVSGSDLNFQWSSAVKALAVLCTGTSCGVEVELSGAAGSLAAALDYALSKPPQWLCDLFGARDGSPLAARYFRRLNPERKRPGPVTVTFNRMRVEPLVLQIVVDGRPLTAEDSLLAFHRTLKSSVCAGHSILPRPSAAVADPQVASLDTDFESAMERAIAAALASPHLTSRAYNSVMLEALRTDKLFQKLFAHPDRALSQISVPSDSKIRFGISELRRDYPLLSDGPPIRVRCSAVTPGLIAIALYLREVARLPIVLDCLTPYGTELVESLIAEGESEIPTVASTGLGPAFPFVNEEAAGYRLFMLGPLMSHRLVSYGSTESKRQTLNEYHFVMENPTSALFYFESIMRSNRIEARSVSLRHLEPEEVMYHAAKRESFRSVLWFPHFYFHGRYCGAEVSAPSQELHVDLTMLFANRALRRDSRRFEVLQRAIRDAWLTLLESPAQRVFVTQLLCRDIHYMKFIRRCAGLHYLPQVAA